MVDVAPEVTTFEYLLEVIPKGLAYEWEHLGEFPDFSGLHAKGLIAPRFNDFYTLAALVVFGGIVLYLLQFFLLPQVARIMGLRKSQWSKFSDSALQTLVFGTLLIVEAYICISENWAFSLDFFPNGSGTYPITSLMSWLYLSQLAWYAYGLVVLLLSAAARKKDLVAFVIHHVVTLFLVGGSYINGNARIGLVVFALHDPADVFLQGAKILRYFGLKKACDAVFVAFALVWVATRCTLFPITCNHIFRNVIAQMYEGHFASLIFTMTLGLYVLVGLHTYWSYLIFRMVYRFVAVKEVEKDIRSDSDDDTTTKSSSSKTVKPGKPAKQD